MEDLSRNLDRAKRVMKQEKKSEKKSWTVILIGDKKRIRSFEITKSLIVTLFVIAFLLVTGAPTALWFYDRAHLPSQTELAEKLKNAQNGLTTVKEENRDLNAKVQILKDELVSAKHNLEKLLIAKKTDQVKPSTDMKKNIPQVKETLPSPETVAEPHAVAIENFETTIDQKNNASNFNFILRNKSNGKNTVSGYIFVILKPDRWDMGSWCVYPRTTLENSRPQNFRRGERFSISRFRNIKGKIRKIPPQKSYHSVSILVFSDDGTLMLEENIALKTTEE